MVIAPVRSMDSSSLAICAKRFLPDVWHPERHLKLKKLQRLLNWNHGRSRSFRTRNAGGSFASIFLQLDEGLMPLQGRWPQADIDLFKAWMDAGFPT